MRSKVISGKTRRLTIHYLDFADKLVLLSHSLNSQQELADELARTVGTVGTTRTKLMNVNAREGKFKVTGQDL